METMASVKSFSKEALSPDRSRQRFTCDLTKSSERHSFTWSSRKGMNARFN